MLTGIFSVLLLIPKALETITSGFSVIIFGWTDKNEFAADFLLAKSLGDIFYIYIGATILVSTLGSISRNLFFRSILFET